MKKLIFALAMMLVIGSSAKAQCLSLGGQVGFQQGFVSQQFLVQQPLIVQQPMLLGFSNVGFVGGFGRFGAVATPFGFGANVGFVGRGFGGVGFVGGHRGGVRQVTRTRIR